MNSVLKINASALNHIVVNYLNFALISMKDRNSLIIFKKECLNNSAVNLLSDCVF